MAERLEPVKPVVIAGAAHAHAPEGNREVFDLQYAVVHAGGTRGGFATFAIASSISALWLSTARLSTMRTKFSQLCLVNTGYSLLAADRSTRLSYTPMAQIWGDFFDCAVFFAFFSKNVDRQISIFLLSFTFVHIFCLRA